MKYSLTDVGNMTDSEIARQIARECGVAIVLSLLGRKQKAQLFIVHILRVVAANKDTVERWMKAQQLAPRLTDAEPGDIEQRILREEQEILNEDAM